MADVARRTGKRIADPEQSPARSKDARERPHRRRAERERFDKELGRFSGEIAAPARIDGRGADTWGAPGRVPTMPVAPSIGHVAVP